MLPTTVTGDRFQLPLSSLVIDPPMSPSSTISLTQQPQSTTAGAASALGDGNSISADKVDVCRDHKNSEKAAIK